MSTNSIIENVPTNIITGFLGTGKTTAILNLLKEKPANERWAVLVNEFGEIGIDGSLYHNQSDSDHIYIREVPGGCMCCTAGLSMQIALNILLTKARPDRLIIEPTGLGHPQEVLDVLSGELYNNVLSIQKTITLIDARHLSDNRYREHDIFNQQLSIADVVVANKTDLYSAEDRQVLTDFKEQSLPLSTEVIITENGLIELAKLHGKTQYKQLKTDNRGHEKHSHGTAHDHKISVNDLPFTDKGYLTAVNKGGGFESVGWRFSPKKLFSRDKLFQFFTSIKVERLKGVFITSEGAFGYNLVGDSLEEFEINDCLESRVEIISEELSSQWEEEIIDCLA